MLQIFPFPVFFLPQIAAALQLFEIFFWLLYFKLFLSISSVYEAKSINSQTIHFPYPIIELLLTITVTNHIYFFF